MALLAVVTWSDLSVYSFMCVHACVRVSVYVYVYVVLFACLDIDGCVLVCICTGVCVRACVCVCVCGYFPAAVAAQALEQGRRRGLPAAVHVASEDTHPRICQRHRRHRHAAAPRHPVRQHALQRAAAIMAFVTLCSRIVAPTPRDSDVDI